MKKKSLLLILFFMSCSGEKFKEVFKLNSMRVIAITAGKQGTLTQAEFSPGDIAAVDAYVSDVANGQVITAKIESCLDPGVSYGAEPDCSKAADRIAYADITLDTSVATGKTGAMPTINVTIPATIFVGRSSRDQFNGIDYLVSFIFSSPSGEEIKAFKRLRATSRSTKNTNPTIGNILISGSIFSSYPSDGDLTISSASNEESYQFLSTDGNLTNLTEQLNVAWYVSNGEINFPITDKRGSTRFKPAEPKASELVIAAVIRDGRGGMAVQIKKVP